MHIIIPLPFAPEAIDIALDNTSSAPGLDIIDRDGGMVSIVVRSSAQALQLKNAFHDLARNLEERERAQAARANVSEITA